VGHLGSGNFFELACCGKRAAGARSPADRYDRMLDYWLRMASAAFALVGCWYLVLMLWPQKFAAAIPCFGALMLVEGAYSFSTEYVSRCRRFRFTPTRLLVSLVVARFCGSPDLPCPQRCFQMLDVKGNRRLRWRASVGR